MDDVIGLVKGSLAVRLGPPRSAGALTLVPLLGAGGVPRYDVAADALAAGTLTIGEHEGGSVPQLVVQNRGERPVLLVDGEHLQGARQDRVLNVTVLAAPMHDTVIPVSCVEQGRWGFVDLPTFEPASGFAYARLRGVKAENVAASRRAGRGWDGGQGAVWAEVERKRAEVGGRASPTRAMRDAFEDRRSELDATLSALDEPGSTQVGVIACVSGRPVAMDLFAHPQVLARLWPRLVPGYAMDALGQRPAPLDAHAVDGLLAAATAAEATSHEGVGLGMDVVLTAPGIVGHALAWSGEVVHLALFVAEQARGGGPSDRIAAPSRRARAWFHTA
jgi:hypothetical protein